MIQDLNSHIGPLTPANPDQPAPDGGVNATAYRQIAMLSGVPVEQVVRVVLAMRLLNSGAACDPQARRLVSLGTEVLMSEIEG